MESEEDSTHDSGGVDDLELMCVVAQTIICNNVVLLRYLSRRRKAQQLRNQEAALEQLLFPTHQRHLPRRPKAIFRHHEAFFCIQRDYLGVPGDLTTPIFKDRTFEMMFRLSRSRVQQLFEDIMATNHPFYTMSTDATGKKGASLEAKVLLPMKTFAYGVPPHTFTDYFQMSKVLAMLDAYFGYTR